MAIAIPFFGAAVGALLSSSLPKLYEAVGNLEDPNRVEELDQELRHINCRIKEILEKCKDMSSSQKALVERMRLLVYDIEDLIDSKDTLGRLQLSAMIKKISGRVTNLQEHLKSFNGEGSTSSKPQQGTSRPSTSTSPALGEAGNDAPKDQEEFRQQHLQLQGMKERVEDVLDLVRWSETTSSEKKPKVISIVGFGGIGKSLLARQVYNSLQDEYPTRAFVQAGKRDTEKVLEEIRENFLRTKEELLKQQDKKLKGRSKTDDGEPGGKGKAVVHSPGTDVVGTSSSQPCRADEKEHRYLVVIDDLMEEQLGKRIISVLESFFAEEDRGKEEVMTVAVTVLLTTSVMSVAEGCRSDHVYKMRPLDDEDSENLFLHVAGIKKPITAREEDSMKEIRMKCDGLPLALVSVAKFCGTDMVGRWKEAWRKLGCPKEKEDYDLARMQRVLDHSYTSLSSHPLQASLLYFCMFPHDHPVRKGSIVRRWLAEGTEVDCRTSATAGQPEDQMSNARRCFDSLVGRNVIWPRDQDVVKTWKPPGVMLEYIKGMSGMLKFIMLSSPDNDNPEDIRRLSLHHTGDSDGEQVLRKNLRRLRTLAVFRKADGGEADLSFTKCKMLRLLDLEACNGLKDRHVDEICKQLRLLKYLSIGGSITQIPRDIEHLQRLETLDLGIQTVVKVPAEVIMLPGLKHLLGKIELLTNYRLVRSDAKSKKLKMFLKTDSNLQTLAGFVTGETIGFPQLMRHMYNLRKVKIWLGTRVSTRNVEDLSASIRDFLARALGMAPTVPFSLSIDFNYQQDSTVHILDKLVACATPPKKRRWWSGKRTASHHGSSPSRHNNHADGAPSQQNLRLGCLASLKLKGFAQLRTVPAFLSHLDFIDELCLSSRVVAWKDILEGVSNLGTLKYLKVVEVDGEDKEDNSATNVMMQKDKLQRLERMCLVANIKLPSFVIENGALSSLISLHLMCQHLADSFEITSLTKLKEVALHYRVQPETKAAWKKVAKGHPNTPQVLLIQSP